MNKLFSTIIIIPMVLLALTPPFPLNLTCDVNSMLWMWLVFISGTLAFLYLYTNVSAWLKLFVIYAFASCFWSNAPFVSFTMYWSVIACAYYYVLCRKITDWSYVYRAVQSIFFLIVLLLIFQQFGMDRLLNFKHKEALITGTIGNNQIAASFICSMAPFLIVNPLNWLALALSALITKSSGAIMALTMGGAVLVWCQSNKSRRWLIAGLLGLSIIYAINTGDIKTFEGKAGRRPVWKKGIELSLKRPQGYGGATWKMLFPYMCGAEIRDQQPGREWNTAHNIVVQFLFEYGIIGFALILGWLVNIVLNVQNKLKLAGLAIVAGTSVVHFPDRTMQTVLILVMFIAWLSTKGSDNAIH